MNDKNMVQNRNYFTLEFLFMCGCTIIIYFTDFI